MTLHNKKKKRKHGNTELVCILGDLSKFKVLFASRNNGQIIGLKQIFFVFLALTPSCTLTAKVKEQLLSLEMLTFPPGTNANPLILMDQVVLSFSHEEKQV